MNIDFIMIIYSLHEKDYRKGDEKNKTFKITKSWMIFVEMFDIINYTF